MRQNTDEFFYSMCKLLSNQSTCIRRQIGAVIVKDKRVLTTGYNGAPSGLQHCLEIGCLREQFNIPSGQKHELCRGAHAEQNAINNAARLGVSIDGATIYCTNHPCSMCAKSIINSGITKVIYMEGYPDDMAKEILINIEVVKL